MSDHVRKIIERIRSLPIAADPTPWKSVAVHAVGGLTEIAFAKDSELLLAVSHNGRGIFDCVSGDRVARDYEPSHSGGWYKPLRLSAMGIGPLAGQELSLAGLHGGGLPLGTADGWTVEVAFPDWPDCVVVLQPPGQSIFVDHLVQGCVKLYEADPIRCCGFSWTGRTLVIASSHTLQIYAR